MRCGAGKGAELVAFDTGDDGFGECELAGGGFVADVFAVVGDVGGYDAAAILEHNRVGGRRSHGEQEQCGNWRCAMHAPILSMVVAYVGGGLLVYVLSGYSR